MKIKNTHIFSVKKLFALLLAVSLLLSGTACQASAPNKQNAESNPSDTKNEANPNPPEETEMPDIGFFSDTLSLNTDADPVSVEDYLFISGKVAALSFATSDTSVCTVDENGTITPTGEGTATLSVTASNKGGDKITKQLSITVHPAWNTNDPDTMEVLNAMKLPQVAFYFPQERMSYYNGSVEIWYMYLSLLFIIPKEGEGGFDATTNLGKDNYNFSFQLYLREHKDTENDRSDYEKIDRRFVPWSVYADPTLTIYRNTFYHSNFRTLVEEGKSYDVIVVIYEGDKPRAWGQSILNWTDADELYIEAAEGNEDVIL